MCQFSSCRAVDYWTYDQHDYWHRMEATFKWRTAGHKHVDHISNFPCKKQKITSELGIRVWTWNIWHNSQSILNSYARKRWRQQYIGKQNWYLWNWSSKNGHLSASGTSREVYYVQACIQILKKVRLKNLVRWTE